MLKKEIGYVVDWRKVDKDDYLLAMERSDRNYCANGRVNGAFLIGKTWNVPEDAEKPARSAKKTRLSETLAVFSDTGQR